MYGNSFVNGASVGNGASTHNGPGAAELQQGFDIRPDGHWKSMEPWLPI